MASKVKYWLIPPATVKYVGKKAFERITGIITEKKKTQNQILIISIKSSEHSEPQ